MFYGAAMRTGRPRKLGSTTPLLVRLQDELLAELDVWLGEVRGAAIGTSTVTRSDLVRDIIGRAVEEHRAQRAAAASPPPAPKPKPRAPVKKKTSRR